MKRTKFPEVLETESIEFVTWLDVKGETESHRKSTFSTLLWVWINGNIAGASNKKEQELLGRERDDDSNFCHRNFEFDARDF